MIKLKSIFKIVLLHLMSFQLYAEQAPYEMHELLLRYNIAAHVKITSHGQDHFRVKVLDVLDSRKSGIVNGDYLKIAYDFSVVCPPSFSQKYAEEHREALAFLSYRNGQWGLTQGKIVFLQEGMASVRFHEEGYQYNAPISHWKKSLQEYTNHFSENKQGRLELKLRTHQFKGKSLTALTQLQYVSYYRIEEQSLQTNKHLHLIEFPESIEEEVELNNKNDNQVYNFAATPAFSDSTMQEVDKKLNDIIRLEYPQLREIGIVGRAYYSLIIEKNGQVSGVEIVKTIAPEVSEAIKSFFSNHNQWKPAYNKKGEAIRFKQTMVLSIK